MVTIVIKHYPEDTIDIRRRKKARNRYKYDPLAPLNARRTENKNTNSVSSSIYHN